MRPVTWWWSSNTTWSTGDRQLLAQNVASINPGSSLYFSVPVPLPSDLPTGPGYIFAVAFTRQPWPL